MSRFVERFGVATLIVLIGVVAVAQRPNLPSIKAAPDAAVERIPGNYDEANLQAQLRMAAATEAALTLERWGLIAGVVNIAGLLAVLLLTLQANRTSMEALKHAEAANALAREVAHTELRAWITFDGSNAQLLWSDDRATFKRLVVQFRFKNTGTTPALGCGITAGVATGPAGQRVPIQIKEPDPARAGAVGPGAEMKTGASIVNADDVLAVCRGEKRVIFFAAIRYRDIFSQTIRETTHATELMVTPNEADLVHMLRSNQGFQLAICNDLDGVIT